MPLRRSEKVLRPVHPNQGVEAEYRRQMFKLIDLMHDSVMYWIEVRYKNNEPNVMSFDAKTPAVVLRMTIGKLKKQWLKRFNDVAKNLAEYVAADIRANTDRQMKSMLKKAMVPITVKFDMTPAQKDIMHATVQANVSLIKSIPEQYLKGVEGAVMRSVQQGRDLGKLTKELRTKFGVTKRKAAEIARDQNNKATSAFQRARQIELGIEEAIWMHSHAGKKPRPTHVAMNGKRYDVKKGMWDSAEKEFILPGTLINCRCTSRSVIPGFS
jgi:SPP1 gp7 family putative phage head morphogenesis protein